MCTIIQSLKDIPTSFRHRLKLDSGPLYEGSVPAESEYNGWKAPVPSSRLTVGNGIAFIRDLRQVRRNAG